MRARQALVMGVTAAAVAVASPTVAGASVGEPLHLKSPTDGAVTQRGHFCPAGVGCTEGPLWQPNDRPRLHARPHDRVVVVTNMRAERLHVELWRPKRHDPDRGEPVMARHPNRLSPRRWRFRLPSHPHPKVDALSLDADYARPEGSGWYWGGLRIR
jgi:hypothetical protein